MTEDPAPRPYELLDVIGDGHVPAGTSLLVTAPGRAGREFVARTLGQGLQDGETALVITTDDPASAVVETLRDHAGDVDPSERIRVIDCQTERLGMGEADSVVVQNVDTPRNLTDIGIGFKNAFDEFEAEGVDRVRFGLLSLSVVLSYVDRETVYRFCQTLTRGIEQEGALGLFLLNVDAHDRETVNTLRRAFDGTVEVDPDGELTVQVSGVDGVDEEWTDIGE